MDKKKKAARMLTNRERLVVYLIALGFDNKEIAEKMFVSTHTIKAFVANILQKLNARNRTHAVYIAIKSNIISEIEASLKSI